MCYAPCAASVGHSTVGKPTPADLRERAIKAIADEEVVAYDVAAEHGQIMKNVQHLGWFVDAVSVEIARRTAKYNHLLGELDVT